MPTKILSPPIEPPFPRARGPPEFDKPQRCGVCCTPSFILLSQTLMRKLLVLFIPFFFLAGCSAGQENGTSPATSGEYVKVFEFHATGAKKSEPFTITGDRFRVKYDCKANPPAKPLCQAFVQSPTRLFQILMNNLGSIKDESVFYGSGEYFIEVLSAGDVSFIVEEFQS